MDIINNLKENPKINYVYNLGPAMWNLTDGPEKIVIVKADDYIMEPINGAEIYNQSDWFKLIESCDIRPWICACLNKKFVIKEAVKLLMKTEPLKLRKNFDSEYRKLLAKDKAEVDDYWEILKTLKLTNQIIEHHKIVNFKNMANDYMTLKKNANNVYIEDIFQKLIAADKKLLYKTTDGILLKDKIQRYESKEVTSNK